MFTNRIALIVGASTLYGQLIARRVLREHGRVVLFDANDASMLAFVSEIGGASGEVPDTFSAASTQGCLWIPGEAIPTLWTFLMRVGHSLRGITDTMFICGVEDLEELRQLCSMFAEFRGEDRGTIVIGETRSDPAFRRAVSEVIAQFPGLTISGWLSKGDTDAQIRADAAVLLHTRQLEYISGPREEKGGPAE